MKVLFDANALMMPFQFNINIDLEIERLVGPFQGLVPSAVLAELRGLSVSEDVARSALRLAEKYDTVDVRSSSDVALVELAKELDAVVVTNDKAVIAALKREGLRWIRLKSGTHLILSEL